MKNILLGGNVKINGTIDKITDTFSNGKEITNVSLKKHGVISVKKIDEFLPNNLIIDLCYFSPKDSNSSGSILKYEKQIAGDNYNEVFETFYKMNNQLSYCYGCYYEFKDSNLQQQYKLWLNSDSYKKKSFQLFYGNGVVD